MRWTFFGPTYLSGRTRALLGMRVTPGRLFARAGRQVSVFLITVSGLVQPAHSATVTYDFFGGAFSILTLGTIDLPDELTSWSSFSGQFEIDSAAIGSFPNSSNGLFSGAAVSIHASYNAGFSVSGLNGQLLQSRLLFPNDPVSDWSLDSFSSIAIDLPSSDDFVAINFVLADSDNGGGGQVLFSDPKILVSSLPDLETIDRLVRLEIVYQNNSGGTAYITGQLFGLSVTPVPVPATAFLLGSGLFCLRRFGQKSGRTGSL